MANRIPSTKLILVTKYKGDTHGYVKVVVYVPGTNAAKFRSTGYKIPVTAWQPDSGTVKRGYVGPDRIGADTINRELQKELNGVVGIFEDALRRGVDFSAEYIVRVLSAKEAPRSDFMAFYLDHIRYLETRCTAAYCQHFMIEWKQLAAFQENISFQTITSDFLERYEISLSKYAETTINSKMKRLKEVVDKAIEREHIARKAVAGYKWPNYDSPVRPYLTVQELKRIEDCVYGGSFDSDPLMLQVACYFIVECHSGIRFSDWSRYEIEQLIDKRSFKVGSTQKNKQPVYLPLSEFRSLDRIVTFIGSRGVKFTADLNIVNRLLKLVAREAKIDKHLTTHIGRHTFGTLCGEKGYSTAWIAQAMGVSEQTAKTYIKRTRKGLQDEVNRIGGW